MNTERRGCPPRLTSLLLHVFCGTDRATSMFQIYYKCRCAYGYFTRWSPYCHPGFDRAMSGCSNLKLYWLRFLKLKECEAVARYQALA
ncbi:hypothetical protein M5689_020462 [Euphorbia peplus]|nr:hypothetical protein M5689_020462 [Euphorbia peplus]